MWFWVLGLIAHVRFWPVMACLSFSVRILSTAPPAGDVGGVEAELAEAAVRVNSEARGGLAQSGLSRDRPK